MSEQKEQQQLTVRLPKDLHRKVKVRVAQKDTSIAAIFRKLVTQWLVETDEDSQ